MPKPNLNPKPAMKTATNKKSAPHMVKTRAKKAGKTVLKSARPITPASKNKKPVKATKPRKPKATSAQEPVAAPVVQEQLQEAVPSNDRLQAVFSHTGEAEPASVPTLKTQPVLANGSVIVAEPLSAPAPLPVQPKQQAKPVSDGSTVVMEPVMQNEPTQKIEQKPATITNTDGVLIVQEPVRQ
jgi:hypothetical protein